MSRLTVTEKEHWKSRIENRINKAIANLEAQGATLMPSLSAKSELEAYEHLGVLKLHQKIEANRQQYHALREEIEQLESAMFKQALGNDALRFGEYQAKRDFENLLRKHRERIEGERLKESTIGQEILKLRAEKEALLDTVWLATSNAQIRELWGRVSEVLGDAATLLQQQILTSDAEPSTNG